MALFHATVLVLLSPKDRTPCIASPQEVTLLAAAVEELSVLTAILFPKTVGHSEYLHIALDHSEDKDLEETSTFCAVLHATGSSQWFWDRGSWESQEGCLFSEK